MCYFKVSASEGVTGLIKGYWLYAAGRQPLHCKKQGFVSLSSREVSALAEDQTKGAIDTGTFTLTVPGGEQGLIWPNGNCDLFRWEPLNGFFSSSYLILSFNYLRCILAGESQAPWCEPLFVLRLKRLLLLLDELHRYQSVIQSAPQLSHVSVWTHRFTDL